MLLSSCCCWEWKMQPLAVRDFRWMVQGLNKLCPSNVLINRINLIQRDTHTDLYLLGQWGLAKQGWWAPLSADENCWISILSAGCQMFIQRQHSHACFSVHRYRPGGGGSDLGVVRDGGVILANLVRLVRSIVKQKVLGALYFTRARLWRQLHYF